VQGRKGERKRCSRADHPRKDNLNPFNGGEKTPQAHISSENGVRRKNENKSGRRMSKRVGTVNAKTRGRGPSAQVRTENINGRDRRQKAE